MNNNFMTLPAARTVLDERRVLSLMTGLNEATRTWREDLFRPGLGASSRAMCISDLFYSFADTELSWDDDKHFGGSRNQNFFTFDERAPYPVQAPR